MALQGWSRVAPNRTRMPIPWAGITALAAALVHMGERLAALAILLATDAYLRPCELLTLRPANIIRGAAAVSKSYAHASIHLFAWETGQTSKTLTTDESVLLDSPSRGWLTLAVTELADRTPAGELLFDLTPERLNHLMKSAANLVGVSAWDISPYCCRHAGPSHHWLTQVRTLPAIKRRGRWASDASVKRYEKSSRVTRRFEGLSEQTLEILRRSEAHIADIVRGVVAPLPRPKRGRGG